MKRTQIFTLTSLAFIAACGDSGGGASPPITPSAMLKITPDNAVSVAKASYDAALASVDFAELSGETGLVASTPGGVSKLDSGIAAASKTGGGASQGPIPPTETPCDGGGKLTVSGYIFDLVTPTLTTHDYFDIDFDLCNDGLGVITDGLMHTVVDDFSGDLLSGLFDLIMTITLDRFQVKTAEDTITSNGSVTVSLNTLNMPSVSVSVSGSSMIVDSNTGSETLLNFASAQTFDGSVFPSPYTMTASGTLDTTQLTGSVRYSTPEMFTGFDNDYPSNGQFFVEGDNSSIRLIAENNVDVTIEIDTDGDHNVDATILTTWAELTN
ncbi:MAG: hypothetical protein OEN22_03120 [Gammaproteobacteria bacterium]|nr:hypothetical protein [Gammaproteobacteria bacterium]